MPAIPTKEKRSALLSLKNSIDKRKTASCSEAASSVATNSLLRWWDRSLPRPVGETGRRSVGNGKERLRDYAGFPGRQPNVPPIEKIKSKNRRGAEGDNYDSDTVSKESEQSMQRFFQTVQESKASPNGSCLILAFLCASRMDSVRAAALKPAWGFHPHTPDKGFHPLTLLRFARY